jgi:hypothetical protein
LSTFQRFNSASEAAKGLRTSSDSRCPSTNARLARPWWALKLGCSLGAVLSQS